MPSLSKLIARHRQRRSPQFSFRLLHSCDLAGILLERCYKLA
jgi:hypothetical protein